MRTVILQSFRTIGVPPWIERCLASVRGWAAMHGHDYEFVDDSIFDLCGLDYLARVGGNKRSITNLSRLELIRLQLSQGYERAVWLDADVFVFAPRRFKLTTVSGYAFGREVWVYGPNADVLQNGAHNAFAVFTRGQADLNLLIRTIRHVVATREIGSNAQVGVWLVSGMQRTLGFPLLTNVAMFSREMVAAVAEDRPAFMSALAHGTGGRIDAANMALSMEAETRGLVDVAMDRLATSEGWIINRHLPAIEDGMVAGS